LGCQNDSQKTIDSENSEVISSFSDGKPKAIKIFDEINGQKICVREIQFYKNGVKSMEGPITDGLRNGEWISWYDDGSVWSKGTFKNNLRDGRGIVYYRNGKIQIDGYYEKGERTGRWKSFDEEGNLISETDYSGRK
jgi:antitoxin component YwqK of YwqJK toxin-antitoxin module